MLNHHLKLGLFLRLHLLLYLLSHISFSSVYSLKINSLLQKLSPNIDYTALGATTSDGVNAAGISVFEGQTEFLPCPVHSAIVPNRTMSRQHEKQMKDKIEKSVDIRWFKNNRPFHRDNGNMIAIRSPDDKNSIGLINAGVGDTAKYTCLINYTLVPPELRRDFILHPSVTFKFHVEPKADMLPDKKPTISHPPATLVLLKGSNATFTCNSITTLSSSTTYWFKACTYKQFNDNCTRNFKELIKEVETTGKTGLLIAYIIRQQNNNVYTIHNVSDADEGLYGCWVQNERGLDIREASLILVQNMFENQGLLTTTPFQHQRDLPPNYSLPSTSIVNENAFMAWLIYFALTITFCSPIGIIMFCIVKRQFGKNKKKNQSSLLPPPVVGNDWSAHANFRNQPMHKKDSIDNYSISKNIDGFISGHLHQSNGHLMTQSICSRILDKEKNPSISSSNSTSDEASSLGKTMSTSSNGDNSRLLYLHTSNTTSTTVPLYGYDHPPLTDKSQQFAEIKDACVINPTYGFLRPTASANEWTFPRRNLERQFKIGEGEFGEVWRYIARQKDGTETIVAVKQLKNRAGLGERERLELINEIEIMKTVNDHPNVIKLLNYCDDDYEPILVIMEFAEHGKLQTYLKGCREHYLRDCREHYSYEPKDLTRSVTSRDLIKFSYHISLGMEYVASKGIIHRDLASRNILVSTDKICKVADFGFARRVSEDSAYERKTGTRVPIKWWAPEAMNENQFTSKSDVFSLGILMWEIVTLGETPYEKYNTDQVIRMVTSGERLKKPAHCKDELFGIMEQCWSQDPKQRPTFKEVAQQLEELLLSQTDYIELDQYQERSYYNILNADVKEIISSGEVT